MALPAGATGISISGGSLFVGGITNSGTITANRDGINLFHVVTFQGGISSNTGTIAAGLGIAMSGTYFSGGIVNSGAINAGSSSPGIIVNGISTFVGGITNTGTITGQVGIDIVGGSAAVSIFDSGIIVGTSGTSINLSGGSSGNTLTLGPGFAINGKVLGSGGDIFQLGGVGSGAFDLSTIGNTKQYQGFTTFNVVGGTWTVSNTFGQAQAWNVNGGTLAGTGTLNTINVNAGGTLAPGVPGSPGGTLNISGNLVMASAATYVASISPTAASRALATGTATVAGTAQVASLSGFYAAGTKLTILTANGGVNGTFGSLVTSNAISASLSYDADDVFLTVKSNPLQTQLPTNAPTNVRNVAAAIDNAVAGGAIPSAALGSVFGLPAQTIQNDLMQLDGEAGTGAQESGFQMMSFVSLAAVRSVRGRPGGRCRPGHGLCARARVVGAARCGAGL